LERRPRDLEVCDEKLKTKKDAAKRKTKPKGQPDEDDLQGPPKAKAPQRRSQAGWPEWKSVAAGLGSNRRVWPQRLKAMRSQDKTKADSGMPQGEEDSRGDGASAQKLHLLTYIDEANG
jgi:hypothetical protein